MVLPAAKAARRDPDGVVAVVHALAARFGNRLVTARAVREQHANTTTWVENQPPDAVVFPAIAGRVQEVCASARRIEVPVIPFGVGTSLEGRSMRPRGVSIDFREMNRVIAVHAEDLDCVVEPGVTRKALNEHLRDSGLFFPIDPARTPRSAAWRRRGRPHQRGALRHHEGQCAGAGSCAGKREMMTTDDVPKKNLGGYDLTRLDCGRGRYARGDHVR